MALAWTPSARTYIGEEITSLVPSTCHHWHQWHAPLSSVHTALGSCSRACEANWSLNFYHSPFISTFHLLVPLSQSSHFVLTLHHSEWLKTNTLKVVITPFWIACCSLFRSTAALRQHCRWRERVNRKRIQRTINSFPSRLLIWTVWTFARRTECRCGRLVSTWPMCLLRAYSIIPLTSTRSQGRVLPVCVFAHLFFLFQLWHSN